MRRTVFSDVSSHSVVMMPDPAIPAPPPTAEPVPAAEPDLSLAEHEAQFGTEGVSSAPPLDTLPDEAPSRGRHRARSQEAGADDVAAIAEYTKRLRQAEEASGIQRKPGESQRVFEIRRRAEFAESVAELKKTAAQRAPAPEAARVPAPAPVAPVQAFTETEPTYAQSVTALAGQPDGDPYQDWLRKLAAYDRRKEAFAREQTVQTERTTQDQVAATERFRIFKAAHDARVAAHVAIDPEYQAIVAKADYRVTPVIEVALMAADNGPALIKFLAQHRTVLDELNLATRGILIDDDSVATMQRLLTARMQAALPTGSAAPTAPITLVPRPPNPVRTTTLIATETPPDDQASIREHERFYGSRTRRR